MRTLIVLLALVLPAAAEAYPQFQLSTGAQRCNQCHIAPAGGGLISGYGRDEAGDTISRGGSGAFLPGLWEPPGWLALGADLRGVTMLYSNGGDYTSPSFAWFPMQVDLYTVLEVSDFSATITIGGRGTARGETAAPVDRLGSREHYLMWRPKTQGPYARAGKFRVPWSLRLVEHVLYVDRHNYQNVEEEQYGVSGGVVRNGWEFHATAYTADPVGRGPASARATLGLAGYFERRQSETFAWGVQARHAFYDPDEQGYDRTTVGLLAKYWLEGPRVLLMAELDVGARQIDAADYTNKELLAYGSATWFVTRGVMLTGSAETFHEDVGTPDTARTAGNLELQYFPWAHVELIGLGRVTDGSWLGMLQLHYYL
jgi:hypothetical protein